MGGWMGSKSKHIRIGDDQVDDLRDQILDELSTMRMKPDDVAREMSPILVSRNAEREADLATDLSEEAICPQQGEIFEQRKEQRSR
jgi:phosphate uptake regulator